MKFEEYKRLINECYDSIREIENQYVKDNALFQVGDLLVLNHGTWEEELVLDDHLIMNDGVIIYYAKKFKKDKNLMALPFELHRNQLDHCKKVGTYDLKKGKRNYDK